MPQKEFDIRLKNKIDTTDNWSTSTLILLDGEVAYEKTADGKLKMKIGNGQDLWKNLPYEDVSQIPDMNGYLSKTLTEDTTIDGEFDLIIGVDSIIMATPIVDAGTNSILKIGSVVINENPAGERYATTKKYVDDAIEAALLVDETTMV